MPDSNKAYMPEAKSTEWATPWAKFKPLNAEFNFTLDVCALDWNTKVPENWFSPADNGLAKPWRGNTAWCNPPYGAENIDQWLAKAAIERTNGTTTVLLLPNTTDCKWFARHVWDFSRNKSRSGVELRFVEGRINFDAPEGFRATSNVKGSILVIVRPVITTVTVCPYCQSAQSN